MIMVNRLNCVRRRRDKKASLLPAWLLTVPGLARGYGS
jgi:hypothetical protein